MFFYASSETLRKKNGEKPTKTLQNGFGNLFLFEGCRTQSIDDHEFFVLCFFRSIGIWEMFRSDELTDFVCLFVCSWS